MLLIHGIMSLLTKAWIEIDDALDLLWKVSQMSNQDQAEKVAEALEYQPLALAAAAVYVQTVVNHGSPNYGWTKYLETFESNEREAREELFVKQNIAYPQTMSSSIKLAVTRVIESDGICFVFAMRF